MWQKVYLWSRKIHRLSMWPVVVTGSWMMLSGFLMYWGMGTLFWRVWHRNVSQWFLAALLIQMSTGLLMWLAPKMIARAGKVTKHD